MQVSSATARIVGRRFRRAAWAVGFTSLTTLSYIGAYWTGLLAGAVFFAMFWLVAFALERAAVAVNKGPK